MMDESSLRDDEIALPPPVAIPLTFTGSGAEYFRIWAVNVSLTLLTLGLYGPWAKARRLRYFYRHTQLDGVAFDYLAQPAVILRGWSIALALFVCYSVAVEYSISSAVLLSSVMCLIAPFLLWRSNQFKARCSRYRGLTFHFSGSLGHAYLAYFPLIGLMFAVPLVTLLFADRLSELQLLFTSAGLFLTVPLAHGISRNYVQANIWYGAEKVKYSASATNMVKIWIKSLFVMLGATLGAVFLAAVSAAMLYWIMWIFVKNPSQTESKALSEFQLIAGTLFLAWLSYQSLGSFFTTHFQNIVWSNTRFVNVSIRSNMNFWGLYGRQCKNTLFVILTLGLYRPFAAVNIAKYRLSTVRVSGWEQLDNFATGPQTALRGAIGDSAAATFEMDLAL